MVKLVMPLSIYANILLGRSIIRPSTSIENFFQARLFATETRFGISAGCGATCSSREVLEEILEILPVADLFSGDRQLILRKSKRANSRAY